MGRRGWWSEDFFDFNRFWSAHKKQAFDTYPLWLVDTCAFFSECCLYVPHIIILCCSSIIWRDAMKKACSCFLKSKRSITLYLWQCLAYGWIYRFLRWRKFSSASKALAKWETSLEMRHAFIGPQVPQQLYFKNLQNLSKVEIFQILKVLMR